MWWPAPSRDLLRRLFHKQRWQCQSPAPRSPFSRGSSGGQCSGTAWGPQEAEWCQAEAGGLHLHIGGDSRLSRNLLMSGWERNFLDPYWGMMKTSHTQLIIQDQKAKSIDKLSPIGGTMGLLTGFSLISIVEFLFLIIKIIASFLQKKLGLEIKL